MAGFPTRPTRNSFGPTLRNETPVVDPETEIGSESYNLAWWQTAGVGLVSPLAVFHCTVAGGVVTVGQQLLAFDPNGEQSKLSFAYAAVGQYTFAFPQTDYPDEQGANRTLTIAGGAVFPSSVSAVGRFAFGQFEKTGARAGRVLLAEFGIAPVSPPSASDNSFTLVLW